MSEIRPASATAPDPGARLQALRERGADRVDRVRFRYMEALMARAADQPGRAGQLLAGKLQALLADYEQRLQHAAPPTHPALAPRPRPLAGLLAHIGQHPGRAAEASLPDVAGRAVDPAGELKSVAYFRDTWLNISVNQQVTQALAQAPENAGPLNSHILVLQSLELMRGIAPEYLKRFMSHSEALLWLEQAESAGQKAVPKPVVKGDKDKKRKSARRGAA